MTERVLGDGAKCCGDCELCRPAPKATEKVAEKKEDRA